jgi:RND family efflux transporter MFP subunit
MTMQRSFGACLPVLAGAMFAACLPALAQHTSQPSPVTVAIAKTVRMAPTIALPGSVVAQNDSHIASQVEGSVVWVAKVGDVVNQNDVIAKLDNNLAQMQYASDSANIARLEATLRYDQAQAGRMQRLAKSNAIATSTRDEALSTRDADKAQLAQAEADCAKSKYALDHSDIRAPFPGRVASRLINPGEYATVGKDIVRLVDINDVEISAPAPISAVRYLHDGTPITVDLDGKYVIAKVRAVVPVGDVNSHTVEIRLTISSADGIVGDVAQVLIPSAPPRNVLAIPRDALVLREDNTYVFRVGAKNIVERIAVETGSEDGPLVEVSGDLAPGDRVVIRGAERLEAGQEVHPTLGS